jgi:hypothetical protein
MKFDDLGMKPTVVRQQGGGRDVEEGKFQVGLYAKVCDVGPPELATKPN